MTTGPLRQYGFSTDLFVSRKESDQTLILEELDRPKNAGSTS